MGRHSRAKGIGYERRLAQKLRAEGFEVRRILEYDGFNHGCDLEIFSTLQFFTPEHPSKLFIWPIAIQAKCTQKASDLETGLSEAVLGRPKAQLHLCFHSFNRRLRILARYKGTILNFTWTAALEAIRSFSPIRSATQPPPS